MQSRSAAISILAALCWLAGAVNVIGALQEFGHLPVLSDAGGSLLAGNRVDGWLLAAMAIVSLFLFCAGLSQAVAWRQGLGWPRFWRRWGQVAGCALLVTAGSYLMFPRSFIYFGVLHGIAVMLIVVRLTAGCGHWLWWLGGLAIAMKFIAAYAVSTWDAADFLNHPGFNWLGLVSRKPITEDWVPLVPWLGVMWWGMAAGHWLLAHRPAWVQAALPGAAAPLSWLGRWSLSYYMLHQPVMIGSLLFVGWVLGR